MQKEDQLYKILVVEDNFGDYVLVEEYISDHFVRVEFTHVTNYQIFKQTLSLNQDFDLIFLDLTLPDKYGMDLIKACAELTTIIPIVVLTGYPDFDFAKKSLSLGISDYLLKEDLNAATLHKCIIYNIERNKNVLKIKESEQYYSDLFQLSPNPLLVYDAKSKLILDVNNSAVDNYNYTVNEFRAKTIDDLETENTWCSELDKNLLLTNNGSKFIIDSLICHQKKNGELLYVSYSENLIIYKGIPSVILSIEDLTKEIIYLQSIQLQNQKLREIAWLQSHVVRAPVARIMGLINLLSENSASQIKHEDIYKMVLQSSLELDSVIREIVNKTSVV